MTTLDGIGGGGGTRSASPSKVEYVVIVTRKGGADKKVELEHVTLSGDVNANSVSAEEMTCELSLTSGDSAIKGSFTVKILTLK